jgi:hypothetical protein
MNDLFSHLVSHWMSESFSQPINQWMSNWVTDLSDRQPENEWASELSILPVERVALNEPTPPQLPPKHD